MEHYLLGIDGGGTKTDALLCDAEGQIIGQYTSGPSGLSGQNQLTAFAHVQESIDAVCRQAGIHLEDITSIYAGISGCGAAVFRQQFERFFESFIPKSVLVRTGSDAVNALSAGIGHKDGIIAIAGTGSCVYGRNNSQMFRVGGCGYLLGDEGSGYDLGRRALAAALRAIDGRSNSTALTSLLRTKIGNEETWFAQVYQPDAREKIASLAPILLSAAELGDETASEELLEAEKGLANAILAAADRCASQSLVISGSIWKNTHYTSIMKNLLGSNFEWIHPTKPPVYGAVVEAAIQSGIAWEVFMK